MPWWLVILLILLAVVLGFIAAVWYIARDMFKHT